MDYSELQNNIYKNASMGITALKQVIPSVRDKEMKNLLVKQYNGYKKQAEITAGQMKRKNMQPSSPNMISQLATRASVAANLKMDNSTEHIARMLIKGTNMGIMDLTAMVNHAKCSSPEAMQAAKNYLRNEQKYIESLKPFL